jgi:uncharacterized SAM-binding protein YcdF (DUF218 family)
LHDQTFHRLSNYKAYSKSGGMALYQRRPGHINYLGSRSPEDCHPSVFPMPNFTLSARWAGFLTVCILILALVAVSAIRWQATLTYLGNFLVEFQPPQQADLILVLGGDFLGPRVVTGAELARLRYAPFALISGPPYKDRPEGEMAVDFLVQKGYSKELFQVFAHHANSTIDEAKALRGELARRHVRRVLLVTANYHTRRATIVLTLFCPGVRFISVPAPDANYHVAGWWNDDSSRKLFFSEWSKILGTVLVAYPTYVISRLFGRGIAAIRVALLLLHRRRAEQHFPNLGDPLGPGDRLASGWPH